LGKENKPPNNDNNGTEDSGNPSDPVHLFCTFY